MEEKWKDIIGYKGIYQISNYGNIKSLQRVGTDGRMLKEKHLKQIKRNDKYLQVTLCKKTYLIHRLVAESFLDNTDNKLEVNHIDGDGSNNIVSNLGWCTHNENMQHSINILGNDHIGNTYNLGNKHTDKTKGLISKSKYKPILQYNLENIFIKEWECAKVAGKILNINTSAIRNCCNGNSKKSGGFIWKHKGIYNIK